MQIGWESARRSTRATDASVAVHIGVSCDACGMEPIKGDGRRSLHTRATNIAALQRVWQCARRLCARTLVLAASSSGVRYKHEQSDDDLCEKDFRALPPPERVQYELISEPERVVVIDAKFYGNVARFINHAEALNANLSKCNVYA